MARIFNTRLALVGLTAILILRLGWLSDDSLITLRTALNTTHGWGPGFNALERVQGYTHPLWFLLWTTLGFISDQWIASILLASIALSVLTVVLLLKLAESTRAAAVVVLLVLSSNSFMEYTSSGLENPLSHFLVVALVVLTLSTNVSNTHFFLLGILTAAILLTRLDLAILVGLPITIAVLRGFPQTRSRLLFFGIGFVPPMIAWFSWSYVTYATLLPNTFQAKRNINIPLADLVNQGWHYLYLSLYHDPATALVLGLSTIASIALRKVEFVMWSLGIIVYLIYVIQNGGDFMVGRFLSVPFVVALAVGTPLARKELIPRLNTSVSKSALLLPFAIIALWSIFLGVWPTAFRPDLEQERWLLTESRGVADERAIYAQDGMALWPFLVDRDKYIGKINLAVINQESSTWPLRTVEPSKPDSTAVACGGVGGAGIVSRPSHHVIDSCGLTDRFIAETPFVPLHDEWRIGHFDRDIPAGYEEAIKESDPELVVEPNERARLRKLWHMIRDE